MAKRNICNELTGTPAEKWEQQFGTNATGNLPQYKRLEHEGNSWNPCPYSTQASDDRSNHILGSVPAKVDHTDVNGRMFFMKPFNQGGWGYVCTYDDCPHFLATGQRFFFK